MHLNIKTNSLIAQVNFLSQGGSFMSEIYIYQLHNNANKTRK